MLFFSIGCSSVSLLKPYLNVIVSKLLSILQHSKWCCFSFISAIVAFLPKSKADKKKSLLGNSGSSGKGETVHEAVDESQIDAKDDGPVQWISYWKPNLTINLADDFTRLHCGKNIHFVQRILSRHCFYDPQLEMTCFVV